MWDKNFSVRDSIMGEYQDRDSKDGCLSATADNRGFLRSGIDLIRVYL